MEYMTWKKIMKENKSQKEKAELLKRFSLSVFTKGDTANIPQLEDIHVNQLIETVKITDMVITKKLMRLNPPNHRTR